MTHIATTEFRPPEPTPMVLHCPKCGLQHIDAPNEAKGWTNPPHKTHQCQGCGHEWRPFDWPTTGVAEAVEGVCVHPEVSDGFGLAGGGFGSYKVCDHCCTILVKECLPDDEA